MGGCVRTLRAVYGYTTGGWDFEPNPTGELTVLPIPQLLKAKGRKWDGMGRGKGEHYML